MVRVANTRSQLLRVMDDCGFRRYSDLNAAGLERWLSAQAGKGMSAGTRNQYRAAWVNFANWSVQSDRLSKNPFVSVPKADEKAHRRPLLDRLTIRRGKHKGEAIAKLRPETRAKLDLLGRERAIIYKALVLTGLRKGELASLTIGKLDLDAPPPICRWKPTTKKTAKGREFLSETTLSRT